MIVVFGSINADLIFPLAALPLPGQTLLADGMTVQPGGKGANQACAAALDGANVVLAGAVGTDALADPALARLREAGVDLSRVRSAPGPTGCAAILTGRDGRNQIVVASGANAAARADQVEDALLTPRTILLTQMEADPAQTAALIRRARAAGARILHNHAPARPLDRDALASLDILLVNEDEADWLARELAAPGAGAASLSRTLGITVIRTLGSAGVQWSTANATGHLPAPAIKAVDTTAAGDCFAGVLAAALDRSQDLPSALHRATTAASLSCTRPGSQQSLPTRKETDAAL